MNPPMCRFCKKAEWNHRCMGPVKVVLKKVRAVEKAKPKPKPAKPAAK